jgi:hypothetical protein
MHGQVARQAHDERLLELRESPQPGDAMEAAVTELDG